MYAQSVIHYAQMYAHSVIHYAQMYEQSVIHYVNHLKIYTQYKTFCQSASLVVEVCAMVTETNVVVPDPSQKGSVRGR